MSLFSTTEAPKAEFIVSEEMQQYVTKLDKATESHSGTLESFTEVLQELQKSSLSKAQKNQIMKAFDFIIDCFGNQKRKNASENSSPFISHPMMVLQILLKGKVEDENTLVAAIVHDLGTGRFAFKSKKMIKDTFGKEVLNLVKEVDRAKIDKLDELSKAALFIFATSFHDNCEDRPFMLNSDKNTQKTKAMWERRWQLIDILKPLKPELAKTLAIANCGLLSGIGDVVGGSRWCSGKSDTNEFSLTSVKGWGGILSLNDSVYRLSDREIREGFMCKIGEKAFLLAPSNLGGYRLEEADLTKAEDEERNFCMGSFTMTRNFRTGKMEMDRAFSSARERFGQFILKNKIDAK